jgi:hypothetical protein
MMYIFRVKNMNLSYVNLIIRIYLLHLQELPPKWYNPTEELIPQIIKYWMG